MKDLFTPSGRLHTPFRIFVSNLGIDQHYDMIKSLGLTRYKLCDPNLMQRQVIIVALGNWTLFADDLFYTLWNSHLTMHVIAKTAQSHDIYYDIVGDCDESYEFGLYRDGVLIRQIHVASPNYSDQIVKVQTGMPLAVESEDRMTDNIEEYVDTIARFVGVRLPCTDDSLLTYGCI